MKDVTSISINSYATASNTYTVLTNGVYDIYASPIHHGDGCQSGTGRYGANLLINGNTVDSYSGNSSATRILKCTRYLTAGSMISVQVRDWCTNCDYTYNSSLTILFRKNYDIHGIWLVRICLFSCNRKPKINLGS